ncbi:MAG: hypothetical protein J6334_08585 [Kiritimatiellae bacterium]|nr:hypothetical protein [Kiritimatiellia bacterium]
MTDRRKMKMFICLILLLSFLGCRHTLRHPLAEKDTFFESIESEFALDWIARHGHTVEDYIKTDFFLEGCRNLGNSDDEINEALADHFVRTEMTTYFFNSPLPGKKLARRILDYFTRTGWTVKRGLLFPEETNGGGDWLRVFEKGDAQIHVHIMGPMEYVANPKGVFTPRTIMFKFHNCSPRSFFPKEVSDLIDLYYTDWESPEGKAKLIPHYDEKGRM